MRVQDYWVQFTLSREGTDLRGLRNSTLAHEVGHIRLGHEGEMRRDIDTMTLSLFPEAPTPIVIQCYRKSYEPREMGWRHRQRERHANQWAACFLLPGEMLRQHEIVQELCEARDAHRDYSKKMLWNRIHRLAEHFQVSGSFVKTRLSELGYMTEEGGELALSHLLTQKAHPDAKQARPAPRSPARVATRYADDPTLRCPQSFTETTVVRPGSYTMRVRPQLSRCTVHARLRGFPMVS